jgi:hypothetical protein
VRGRPREPSHGHVQPRQLGPRDRVRRGARGGRPATRGHQLQGSGSGRRDLLVRDRTIGGRPPDHRDAAGEPNGQMHGEEWPGPHVVDLIRAIPTSARASYAIWTVRTMNPDGGRIGRRFNSHRVDLNGNFPAKFLRMAHTGPWALSEPESASMVRFLTWVQPDLIISLHGFSQAVDTTGGGARAAWARAFSRLSNITPAHAVPCGGPCHGNMTDWYSATSRVRGVAFTVEMPRSSQVVRRCGVPGRPARATPIQCTAWAAVYLAPRLPA